MTIVKNNRGRGRPRAFDHDSVLERAMQVFWAAGYEAASIPMLTDAMGISAQSLYAAFGSKDALYRDAIDYYSRTVGGFAARALDEEPDAIKAVTRLLREAAINFARTTGTPGCMITTAPADVTETPLTLLGRELRAESVRRVAARLKRGIDERQLSNDFNYAEWARYIGSVVQGMSVQARDGAPVDALLSIAEIAAQSTEAHRLRSARRRRPR